MTPPAHSARIGLGDAIAGLGAVLLLAALFLPWYDGEASISLPGGGDITAEVESADAWQSFTVIDAALLFAALATLVAVLARALRVVAANAVVPPALVVAVAGTVATLLIVYRLIDAPTEVDAAGAAVDLAVGRRIGIYLALVAAAAIALGGYTAVNAPERPRARD